MFHVLHSDQITLITDVTIFRDVSVNLVKKLQLESIREFSLFRLRIWFEIVNVKMEALELNVAKS